MFLVLMDTEKNSDMKEQENGGKANFLHFRNTSFWGMEPGWLET